MTTTVQRRRSTTRVPWLFAALALVGLVPTAILTAVNGSIDEDPLFVPVAMMMIAGYSVTGAVLASRQPRNAIGWLLLAIGGLFLLTGLSDESMQWLYRDGPTANPLGPVSGVIASVLWLPMIAIASLLFLLFPTGTVPGPRWRFLPWAIVSAIAVFLLASLLHPGPLEDTGLQGIVVRNPLGVPRLEGIADLLITVSSVVVLVGVLPCFLALVVRFARARGEERQQVRWLATVAVAVLALVAVQIVLSLVLGDRFAEDTFLNQLLFLVTFALIGIGVPASMGIAVLRYRLYDLDLVVRKTIVFAVLVVLVMALSLGALLLVSSIVTDRTRDEVQAVGIAMLLVGLSVWPLWRFARRIADRIVYGGRATPYEVLTEFGQRVGETYSADDVLPRMAELLGQATGAASAHVWIVVGGGFRRVASWPADPSAAALPDPDAIDADPERASGRAAVRDRGEVLGALSVEMPASDPMSPAKQRIVRDLAAQAGLLLRNVRLIEELRESRRRIVSAQDDRAKRLERNIHDGAQQQLVALSVKARLARTLNDRDPAKAGELLAEIERETQSALEDLRDLARGIYPPLLADRGLVEALGAQARRSPVPVTIEPDGLGRYGPEVEAGVYFSVLEALQNVAKYAEASSARVLLEGANGEVRFEVCDDGRGFDPADTRLGTGLQGIVDRVSALGGEVEITSLPGHGTTIAGRVPTSA
ncbi:MAG TPA: histidine kinase [Actinomycetota bacterium]|nr:histidine kinase [Actinomycetota bacterium]